MWGNERVSTALGKPGTWMKSRVVAITLNGARGKRCDIDRQAEGRESGERMSQLALHQGPLASSID